MLIDPDGNFPKKKFDDYLNQQISADKVEVKAKTGKLQSSIKDKESLEKRLLEIDAETKGLETQRKDVTAKRKPLESKKTKRTEQEAKDLNDLKKQNTSLVQKLSELNTEKGKLKSSVIRLTGSIEQQEQGLKSATTKLEKIKILKKTFDAVYAKATATSKEDVEILTDVVTNEAGSNSRTAKTAIAYAYTHDTKLHMEGGHLVTPPEWGPGSISYFSKTTEGTNFDKSTNKDTYISQVIESLEVSSERLADTTDKFDPTQGATNWVSPNAMKNGLPQWAKAMNQIIVPGIPKGVFTFLK
jgi:predicted  nucleic acid-binding Zn-ribbon protein